jgi:hypothetical protein
LSARATARSAFENDRPLRAGRGAGSNPLGPCARGSNPPLLLHPLHQEARRSTLACTLNSCDWGKADRYKYRGRVEATCDHRTHHSVRAPVMRDGSRRFGAMGIRRLATLPPWKGAEARRLPARSPAGRDEAPRGVEVRDRSRIRDRTGGGERAFAGGQVGRTTKAASSAGSKSVSSPRGRLEEYEQSRACSAWNSWKRAEHTMMTSPMLNGFGRVKSGDAPANRAARE